MAKTYKVQKLEGLFPETIGVGKERVKFDNEGFGTASEAATAILRQIPSEYRILDDELSEGTRANEAGQPSEVDSDNDGEASGEGADQPESAPEADGVGTTPDGLNDGEGGEGDDEDPDADAVEALEASVAPQATPAPARSRRNVPKA